MINLLKKTKNQSGRSMVEMLGVLAVIGVLSIGGIAGYRAAMEQNEINNYLNNFELLSILVASGTYDGSEVIDGFYLSDNSLMLGTLKNKKMCETVLDQLDLNSVKDYFYDFIDIPNRNGAFYLGQLGMLDCEGYSKIYNS